MKVLVVGNGGREHAIAWRLQRSPSCSALYATRPNAGLAQIAQAVDIAPDDVDGLVAFASSLDQVGPLANCAEDLALLLEVLAGHDPRDSTSAPVDVPAYQETVTQPLEGLRVGWIPEQFRSGLDPEIEAAIREAIAVYRSLGATIEEVSLPHAGYGI